MSSRNPMSSIRSTSSRTTNRMFSSDNDPPIQQIDHASRRADQNLRAMLEEFHLCRDLLPAIHRHGSDRRVHAPAA